MISLFGLEEALVKTISGAVSVYQLKSGPPKTGEYILLQPRVYSGYIPAAMAGDARTPTDYPSIVLQAVSGRHTYTEGFATVEIVIGVYNDDIKMRGYRDVLNLIMCINSCLWGRTVIAGNYSLQEPYEWMMLEESKHPFYLGKIKTTWAINTPSMDLNPTVLLTDDGFLNLIPGTRV